MAYVGMHTDRGRVKSVDQDACCYLEANTSIGRIIMAVICDGVGGLSKGELASTTVIRRFVHWFSDDLPKFIDFNGADPNILESIRNVWGTLLQVASKDIYEYGEREGVTLGTTFTGMIAVGRKYLIGHVGDCRAYEITSMEARQLTSDQTLVAQQVAAGIITPEEAANHPKRNVILQSVGTHETVDPEFIEGELSANATYLFCCDGFYNKLSDTEFTGGFSPMAFSSEDGLREMCERYVNGVMSRGEKDNVTVLAFTEAHEPDRPAAQPSPVVQPAVRPTPAIAQPAEQISTAPLPSVVEPLPLQAIDFADARDNEEDSPTVLVDEEDSPTIVVKGGEA